MEMTYAKIKAFESEENQAVLRDKVLQILYKNKKSIKKLSEETHLAYNTVFRFLKRGRDVDFKSLCIINEYFENHEVKQ